jgi:hypothetical protein
MLVSTLGARAVLVSTLGLGTGSLFPGRRLLGTGRLFPGGLLLLV